MRIDSSSADPFYQQIKDSLRGDIVSGKLKAGACIPDERSLADSLDVSRKTTRRALLELTSEGLLRRVRGKGTFVRESLGRQLAAQSTTIVVACMGSPFSNGSPYFSEMLNGIHEAARELRLSLSFEQITEPYDQFVAAMRTRPSARGVIAIWTLTDDVLHYLARLEVPVVLLDCNEPSGSSPFDVVTHDGEPGVRAAVKHLFQLGHTDIAFMRPENLTTGMKQRLDGYLRAHADEGLPVREERIIQARFMSDSAYAVVTRLLREQERPPTAIVCAGDEQAIATMAAAVDFGWRVPQDLSVIGFGHHAQFTSPRLSTVRVPTQHMGAMAVRMLEMRLAHAASPVQRMIMPVEWLAYGSCAPPRVSKPSAPKRRSAAKS
jgi:DNA-binding LacI/PurR family transcriptional regulator